MEEILSLSYYCYGKRNGEEAKTKKTAFYLIIFCLMAATVPAAQGPAAQGTAAQGTAAAVAGAGEPLRLIRLDIHLSIKPADAEASSIHPPDKEKEEDLSAKNAIDGKLNTRWNSAPGEPQWLILDLDDVYNINKVMVSWGPAYAASYKIETSEDRINWKEAYSTDTGKGRTNTVAFPLTEAKYIKIDCVKKGGGQGPAKAGEGFSISEVSVYGKRELVLF